MDSLKKETQDMLIGIMNEASRKQVQDFKEQHRKNWTKFNILIITFGGLVSGVITFILCKTLL